MSRFRQTSNCHTNVSYYGHYSCNLVLLDFRLPISPVYIRVENQIEKSSQWSSWKGNLSSWLMSYAYNLHLRSLGQHSEPQLSPVDSAVWTSRRKKAAQSPMQLDVIITGGLAACLLLTLQLDNLNKLFIQIATAVILITLPLENLDCWVQTLASSKQMGAG